MSQSRVYEVRQLLMALKTMGALLYGRDPAVRAKMLETKVGSNALISTITRKASTRHAA